MIIPQTHMQYRECPVIFPAGEESIYGIYVEPSRDARDVGVILLTGGGYLAMTHRNRMWVHLARRLAAERFPVLRFDYHGIGESTGFIDVLELDRPFVADLVGAVDVMRTRGIRHVVLVGSCFGARTILAGVDRIPELRGAVVLSTPVGSERMGELAAERLARELTLVDYVVRASRLRVVRRVFDPEWRGRYLKIARVKIQKSLGRRPAAGPGAPDGFPWVSGKFMNHMRHVAQHRLPLLMLYGAGDTQYDEFRRALAGELGEIMKRADGFVEVRIAMDGMLHGFTDAESQDVAIRHSLEWVTAEGYLTTPVHPGSSGAGKDQHPGVVIR